MMEWEGWQFPANQSIVVKLRSMGALKEGTPTYGNKERIKPEFMGGRGLLENSGNGER